MTILWAIPAFPPPRSVNESIKKLVDEMDSIKLHGYSMAASFDTARAAVAKDLAERFGLDVKRQRAVLHLRRCPRADLHHQGPDRGR